MRTFEIVSALGRRKKPVAWLRYDETTHQATIELAEDARIGHVPAMFNRYLELGQRIIDSEWTLKWISERIPPASRHNIDEILAVVGITEYDPYPLLFYNGGRCSQDDFFLREVADVANNLPEQGSYEYALIALEDDLGSRLTAARQRAGMTQQELSYRTGIRQSTISRLEHGQGNPTVETLACIADALGLQLNITFDEHLN